MTWEPTQFQTKSPNGWALVVFYRAVQQAWVFQATKGSVLYYNGVAHATPEKAQHAAVAWSRTR